MEMQRRMDERGQNQGEEVLSKTVPCAWTAGAQVPTKQVTRQAKSHRFMVQAGFPPPEP